MRKNIALFISIVALILFILFLRVNINKVLTNSLNGTEVTDGIYGYDLETENLSVNGIIVKEEGIYYLLMDVLDEQNGVYNYKLKKLDIYENNVIEVQSKNNFNSYCTLREENIYCLNSNNFTVYDLDFSEQFSYTKEENSNVNYMPYKDIYITLENKEINLIRNNLEENYRTIDTEINLYYEDYLFTEDNTFILLLDEEGKYYIYNVNEANLTTIEQANYFKYENGYVFYNEINLSVYDLINNKEFEYENSVGKDYYYTGLFNDATTTFYLYDVIDNKLFILNANQGTLQELDSNLLSKDNPIATIMKDNKYLYISLLQDKDNFFVIDLNKLNIPTIDIEEYTNELISNINKTITNIKDNYDVNINIKEEAVIKFPDFSAEVLLNNEIILESLNKIDTILSKYDKEFFESFYGHGFNGLNLYLTGSLTPSDYETQAANPAAYSLTFNGEYMIVIDLNQPNIEELLCHELLHNLEFNLNNQGIYPFNNWSNYNPSNFYYNNSYTSNTNFNYTLKEDDPNNVYFIDYYSHTYATEDRARVFEKICACSEDSIINDYPNLYNKGVYLKEEITKYYPSLLTTSLFASLN